MPFLGLMPLTGCSKGRRVVDHVAGQVNRVTVNRIQLIVMTNRQIIATMPDTTSRFKHRFGFRKSISLWPQSKERFRIVRIGKQFAANESQPATFFQRLGERFDFRYFIAVLGKGHSQQAGLFLANDQPTIGVEDHGNP